MKLFFLCLPILFLTLCVDAQTASKAIPIKIAEIDVYDFYNEKTGIKKLARAEKLILSTDCGGIVRHTLLEEDIKKLEKEITVLEYQKLPTDIKLKKLAELKDESQKAILEERKCKEGIRKQTIDPIAEIIRNKLKEFAELKGYKLIIDKSAILHSSVEADNLDDITVEFIKYCNDFFDKESSQ